MLKDNCHRRIDYLRISVTDRCNLRCSYCMPKEGIVNYPHQELLTFEETLRLVRIFASLGVNKIRLTGGEPLVRKGIINLVKSLSGIQAIEELNLTTNGTLLSFYAQELKSSGIKGINISLDTLKHERFKMIAGDDSLSSVLGGIDKAREVGFQPVKLNVVVMRGINDDEVIDFVNFAQEKKVILRFIEFMKVTPLWKDSLLVSIEEIKDICHKKFDLQKVGYRSLGPAEYYQFNGGLIGFIKTAEENCSVCSRLRITSTGELKLCLYSPDGVSLRDPLRKGFDDRYLGDIIKNSIALKNDTDYKRWDCPSTYMCSLGG